MQASARSTPIQTKPSSFIDHRPCFLVCGLWLRFLVFRWTEQVAVDVVLMLGGAAGARLGVWTFQPGDLRVAPKLVGGLVLPGRHRRRYGGLLPVDGVHVRVDGRVHLRLDLVGHLALAVTLATHRALILAV